MALPPEALNTVSMILAVIVAVISIFVYYQLRNNLSIMLAWGFAIFAVSFFVENSPGFPGGISMGIILRTFAFVLIMFALFFYLGDIRSQVSILSEKNRQLELEIKDRIHAEEAMLLSEHRLSYIIDFLPDATFAIDLDGTVIAWNRAIEEMTGISAGKILGKGDHEYAVPFYGTRRPMLIDLVTRDAPVILALYPGIEGIGNQLVSEAFFPDINNGKGAYLWFIASPLLDARGNLVGAVESIRDITDRKTAEAGLRHSLGEKDVLLKEVHHRVKNNLQVVTAMIELQIQYMKDPNSINILRDSQNRIRTMALIHETLYRSHDLARVEFPVYIEKIVHAMFASYTIKEGQISTVYDIDPVELDVDTAIHCGLIVNELVSNSFKHAFPDGRKGTISIGFHRIGSTYRMSYADDGTGIPDSIDFGNTESLGMKLIHLLATEQLEGTVSLNRVNGTRYEISFPVKER